MNTATNPRTQASASTATGTTAGNSEEVRAENGTTTDTPTDTDEGTDDGMAAGPHTGPGFGPEAETAAADAPLERRTRPQQLLDGLVGACKTALATGTLPATGGLRPQVMVTISYQDLLNRLETTATNGPRYTTTGNPSPTSGNHPEPPAGKHAGSTAGGQLGFTTNGHPAFPAGHLPASAAGGLPGTTTGTGTFTFTGPVTPATIRKIACDADIIPVLLGSEGRILDIGRTTRIFPPHIRKAITARDQGCTFPNCTIPAPWCEAHHRKAITARDQGCTFPNCTIPAPWCEAHHTTYWSHGGPTSTENGTLLCTHHHHLIHKEQWQIHMQTGIPWFIPPPHIDPQQTPRRNHHHRL
ncbi:hypothetical protein ASG92_07335 [Arthrobacter sp. Soil736]|nr:hypothetical protein ASG92_07335 [Arthrobacter sp. Soil736]